MKYLLSSLLVIICCACDSKFDNEDSHAFRSRSIQEAINAHKNIAQTNSVQKSTRPKISYWKDSEPEYKETVIYDVMTAQLVEDLKNAIDDIDVDDESKANAIRKFATIKCKKADISEVFESISFLKSDVRDKLINDIIKSGTPVAKSAVVDTINWIKATEDVSETWIEFVEENQKQNVTWTDEVLNDNADFDADDNEFDLTEDEETSN